MLFQVVEIYAALLCLAERRQVLQSLTDEVPKQALLSSSSNIFCRFGVGLISKDTVMSSKQTPFF